MTFDRILTYNSKLLSIDPFKDQENSETHLNTKLVPHSKPFISQFFFLYSWFRAS